MYMQISLSSLSKKNQFVETNPTYKMRVAVIGGGSSGAAAAYVLAEAGVEVVVYEKEDNAKTVSVEGVDVDLDFMGFNHVRLQSVYTSPHTCSSDSL